ncbi:MULTISPECIES: hypothetical protein [Streptacidiphilus]|uniref:cGAS/DncV-like nucleotidyltransferase C-terminal helical domain-containing protein n=1 Tax=Streptacidiphilus cavernicola TaxID=3342716 RepID=A0ABV6UWE8_9ACTN|nr:hypothetical protein [Streptacidiphilus jeojiense]
MGRQLTEVERIILLQKWIAAPTQAEADRLERAQRMVNGAVRAHPAFAGLDLTVKGKGSYANNTNVRFDADVDVKVQLNRPHYRGFGMLGFWPWAIDNAEASQGPWTPARFREELGLALKACFNDVDANHNVAFYVPPVPGSRPSADVVPCFAFRQYRDFGGSSFDEGSVVFTRDGGRVINWPEQQLANGIAKNNRTKRRYKFAVRALKQVENAVAADGLITALPSYFSECLIYNVPDSVLLADSLDTALHGALAHLRRDLNWWSGGWRDQLEPNEMKKVFGEGQKWTIQDGRQLIEAAFYYLNYG